jgi:hypothetical protein
MRRHPASCFVMPIQLEFNILKAKLMALRAILCDFLVIAFVQLNDPILAPEGSGFRRRRN